MAEYREVTGVVQVPNNTGIDGFLHTLKNLLRKPHLQKVIIDARGTVTFTRYVLEDEGAPDNYGIDFDSVQPYHVIRNAKVEELRLPAGDAAITVGRMFDRVSWDRLRPLAFCSGAATMLYSWYEATTYTDLRSATSAEFFGLPLLLDRNIDDRTLFLCAGYGRDAAFLDTRVSYKIEIPSVQNVEVLL